VEKVINMANDFSLPFCQLKLQILFNADSGEEIRNGIIDVMFKAAVTDVRARRSRWVDLVALMSKDAVRQVCIALPSVDFDTDLHRSDSELRKGSSPLLCPKVLLMVTLWL